MSFAWETRVPIPDHAISLHELSLLVAERSRFEALGVPRIPAMPPVSPRRARRHAYISGQNSRAHLGPMETRAA